MGCRLGELLSIQWQDVRWKQDILLVHADNTKTAETRDVPISRQLKAVLDMRSTGRDGKELPPSAYVFRNEVGEAGEVDSAGVAEHLPTTWHPRFAFPRSAARVRVASVGVRCRASHRPRLVRHADITTANRHLATTRVGVQHSLKRFEERRPCRSNPEKHAAPLTVSTGDTRMRAP